MRLSTFARKRASEKRILQQGKTTLKVNYCKKKLYQRTGMTDA